MKIVPPLGAGQWLVEPPHVAAAQPVHYLYVDGRGQCSQQVPARLEDCAQVYLGSADGVAYFALWAKQPAAGAVSAPGAVPGAGVATARGSWQLIRDLAGFTPTQMQLYAAANGLAAFHLEYRFCHACAHALDFSEGGWARHCPNCNLSVYPRQDPAVIVAILDSQDRLLLAHNTAWPAQRVSLVAGFVNMGEAGEQAVVREIREEVGLTVKVADVEYLATQTWPFPRSLMLVYKVRVPAGVEPTVDGVEIGWARWFSRAAFREALANGAIQGPVNHSVAAAVVRAWLANRL